MISIKYPKLLLLLLSFVIAYTLFYERNFLPFHNFLLSIGHFGTFLAGVFYAYGFTAAPATAILLLLAKEQNIILAGFIGGAGALIGDLIIFLFIRHTFNNEIKMISKTRFIGVLKKKGEKTFGYFHRYLLVAFAGFIIASPLPTEIGVTLMASIKNMSVKKFAIIAYILHTAGIFVISLIGNLV